MNKQKGRLAIIHEPRGNTPLMLCLEKDKQKRASEFFQSIDPSWLVQWASKTKQYQVRGELVGMGRQFQVWRIKARSKSQSALSLGTKERPSGNDFVIKIPTLEFLGQKAAFQKWVETLPLIQKAWQATLLPPFITVQAYSHPIENGRRKSDIPLIVMPWAGGEVYGEWKARPSAQSLVHLTELWLRQRGLTLADIPQIRFWHDIPIIVDIGDIRRFV